MVAKSSNSLTAKTKEQIKFLLEWRIEDCKRRIRHEEDHLKKLIKHHKEKYGDKK